MGCSGIEMNPRTRNLNYKYGAATWSAIKTQTMKRQCLCPLKTKGVGRVMLKSRDPHLAGREKLWSFPSQKVHENFLPPNPHPVEARTTLFWWDSGKACSRPNATTAFFVGYAKVHLRVVARTWVPESLHLKRCGDSTIRSERQHMSLNKPLTVNGRCILTFCEIHSDKRMN